MSLSNPLYNDNHEGSAYQKRTASCLSFCYGESNVIEHPQSLMPIVIHDWPSVSVMEGVFQAARLMLYQFSTRL